MKKIVLLMLVGILPYFTMAQKRSKKGSKSDKVIASSYDFMVIKGAEIDMSEDRMDPAEQAAGQSDDISLERRMKKLIKAPTRLIVSFDSGDMRGKEIGQLMRKSNEIRTMAAAVKEASVYGWEFVSANVVVVDDGVVHYYYMRRFKAR